MNWKEKIFVFDDLLTDKEQIELQTIFLSQDPDWKYISDISGSDGKEKKRPGFNLDLFSNGRPRSQLFNFVLPLIEKAIEKVFQETGTKADYRVEKSRAFLQVPLANLEGREYDNHHIDYINPHLAILYYLCDADGETVLFDQLYHPKSQNTPPPPSQLTERTRVLPKRGRTVIFDGYRWHTATQPKKCDVRCVINSNLALSNPSEYYS